MEKTDYQKGYEDGQELIAAHVNSDGKPKAKEYIKKLSNKNKGKTDAFDYFIDNSVSYYVPPTFLEENKTNNTQSIMRKNRIRLTESQLHNLIKKAINEELDGTSDVMDAIIMLKEAYVDIQEITQRDSSLSYDLSVAMGNIRGAIKILGNFA